MNVRIKRLLKNGLLTMRTHSHSQLPDNVIITELNARKEREDEDRWSK